MDYTISPINWNSVDEVVFSNKDNAWEELFPIMYSHTEDKWVFPMVFIAKNQDGTLIWRVIISCFDPEKEKEYFVKWISQDEPSLFGLYVDERYRNYWIWKWLVNMSIEYCKNHWFHYLSLDTNTAAEFYKKNWGFQFSHSVEWYNSTEKEIENLDIYFLEL